MASMVKSAARGGTIASATSAARSRAFVSATSAARGATIVSAAARSGAIVSLTSLGARRKDSKRRRAILPHTVLSARRNDPGMHGMMAWRSRHGPARGNSHQMQPTANDDYEEDDAEDGYKSPPGSPPRAPLKMKWKGVGSLHGLE